MAELPVALPSVKVETESRVILQLPSDVQAALERKALDSKMTLTDFWRQKSMRSFTTMPCPDILSLIWLNIMNFRKTRINANMFDGGQLKLLNRTSALDCMNSSGGTNKKQRNLRSL